MNQVISNSSKICEFNEKGFPIVQLFEDYFCVKDLNYSEFRTFYFDQVSKVSYQDFSNSTFPINWGYLFFYLFSKHNLTIDLNNGGAWSYDAPIRYNKKFSFYINQLNRKIQNYKVDITKNQQD
jgi:hypothetical protein